jgi:hypothetical protein
MLRRISGVLGSVIVFVMVALALVAATQAPGGTGDDFGGGCAVGERGDVV